MTALRTIGIVALAAALASCGGDPPLARRRRRRQSRPSAPASGSAAGGTAVRISGANFAAGASVTIGGVAATNVVVESATSITGTTGAHAAGAADVVVTVSGRSGSLPGAFTFQAASIPPSITALSARGSRSNEPSNFADVGEPITVTATVQDTDTPLTQLTYEWSAPSGTFSGTGASVQWTAPASTGTVTLTLTVSDGTRVSRTVDVSVHDSIREVGDLARLFLLDFSDSSKSPEFVMRNFSTSARCAAEVAAEFQDVVDNRDSIRILSWTIGDAAVTVQFGAKPCSFNPLNGDACAAVPATWDSLCIKTTDECIAGQRGISRGVDYITAVYDQTEWKLCASRWQGQSGFRMMR